MNNLELKLRFVDVTSVEIKKKNNYFDNFLMFKKLELLDNLIECINI